MKLAQHGATTLKSSGGSGINRTSKRLVFTAFRWVVTTNWFLFLSVGAFVGVSLWLSLHNDSWHWFQRSGALVVSIGAILSTRRPLRLMLNSILREENVSHPASRKSASLLDSSEIRTCVCGFLLVAIGTLIWAYGDLFGCLLHWDGTCLR